MNAVPFFTNQRNYNDQHKHRPTSEAFRPKLGWKVSDAGRFWLCVVGIVSMLTHSVAFADTTWVSGAVSGEWTREGNPYIVVDSTWVPEGDTLTLLTGVELVFNEGQGLEVFGTLNVSGDVGGRVQLHLTEGSENWKGVRFYGSNQTNWEWASINCPSKAFLLSPQYTVTMNNCRMNIVGRPFRGINELDQNMYGCNLVISNTNILGGMYWVTVGGSIILDHSDVNFYAGDTTEMPGFSGEGTLFRLTNSTIHGSLRNYGGLKIIEYCRFLRGDQRSFIFASAEGAGGRMIGTFVEGGSGLDNWDNARMGRFEHNTVIGACGFSGNVQVSDCDIRGTIDMSFAYKAIFKNSVLSRGWFVEYVDSLLIDSCQLVYEHDQFNNFIHSGSDEHLNRIIIQRSVLKSRSYIFNANMMNISMQMDHNTLFFETDAPRRFSGNLHEYIIENNIIVNNELEGDLFFSVSNLIFRYNSVSGFNRFTPDDSLSLDSDSTNIIADPRLQWFGFSPLLSQDSPCIDRADPNFPLDADGTRSDIGAWAFYHANSIIGSQPEPSMPEQYISIFPNPFNSSFTVAPDLGRTPVAIDLLDLTGRVVSSPLPTRLPGARFAFNASDLPAGAYFVRLQTPEGSYLRKVNCLK